MMPVLSVDHLSKRYMLGGPDKLNTSFREMLMETIRAPFKRYKNLSGQVDESQLFWALEDINFNVNQGEVVGIIGKNGAGKSTLLKVLSRITTPTAGSVTIKGNVASLLEVGTGFHPELSGRENIYLNGAILGMRRKEINAKFDAIVEFANVEKFVDTPVKRYSSGMYVRLAFSIAAHLDPDILIVDEVLAVGDLEFQKRCLGKLGDIANQGRTVLFVSHNMNSISRLCDRAILLDNGRVSNDGNVDSIVRDYLKSDSSNLQGYWERDCNAIDKSNEFIIDSLKLCNSDTQVTSTFRYDEKIDIEFNFKSNLQKDTVAVGFGVIDLHGNLLFVSHHRDDKSIEGFIAGKPHKLKTSIPSQFLCPGEYTFSAFAQGCESRAPKSYWTINLNFNVTNVGYDVNIGRLGLVGPKLDWQLI